MVNIMARSATGQPNSDDCDEPDAFDAAARGDLGMALGVTKVPMDPSTCIFWCAVALGALVKGYPIESVANYTRLATDALAAHSGPPSVEVAKAWTILAHLYGFMGNTIKFQEYLGLSNWFLDAYVENGSSDVLPVGFAEMIHHTKAIKVCSFKVRPGEIETFCAHHESPPQINAAADETELYRYVTQSFRVFEQAVFSKASQGNTAPYGRSEDAEPQDEDDPHRGSRPLPSEFSDAFAAGLKENIVGFERLEETVDRPVIRQGYGGLLINGTLVFKKASKGDADGTLERIARCVEVYERYPGLSRCSMRWFHIAHVMLIAVAALDGSRAEELYRRLRAAYNPFRPPGSQPVPPLEEWQGVSSFCEDLHCRTTECVIASGALDIFSRQPGRERGYCEVHESLAFDGQNHAGVSRTGVIREETRDPTVVDPHSGGPSQQWSRVRDSNGYLFDESCQPTCEI